MSASVAQVLAWCAAFWTAVLLFARAPASREHALRFALGLVLGAASAHLGWALLHLPAVREEPWAIADPSVGFSALFVPLGPLLVAPWCASARRREAYLSAATSSLPLALAVARLGCLAAGCCHGVPTELPWGVSLSPGTAAIHPTPLYEIAGLAGLDRVARHLPERAMAPAVLAGLGLLRLLVEPLRAAPPLGEPWIPIAWVAGLWVAIGLLLALRTADHSSAQPSKTIRSGAGRELVTRAGPSLN